MLDTNLILEIAPFLAVGFAAQLIDGALGMAYGVISTTLLVGLGLPPAAASAGVHTAEVFTTGASGISHALHRNVDWRLFARLLIPGVLGGVLGAYVLTRIHGETARPFVLAYLTLIGIYLLWRGLRHSPHRKKVKVVEPLALAGGFLDAAGGGGWGPVVTSNLLLQGGDPRKVIGTVNTVEFFLTIAISATFIMSMGVAAFTVAVVGLLLGGVAAAPFGGYIAKKVAPKALLIMVGTVLTLTSLYGVYRSLFT